MSTENRPPLRKPAPIGILLAIVTAGATAVGWFQIWFHRAPALEAFYFSTYVKNTFFPSLRFPNMRPRPKRYAVVFAGETVATDSTMPTDSRSISVRYVDTTEPNFTAWLKRSIYHGKSVTEAIAEPLLRSASCFLFFLIIGVAFDGKRLVAFRKGRKLRGPDIVSRWRFNRRIKGDGLHLRVENRPNPIELFRGVRGAALRIQKRHEAQHFQAIGDPGTGKTQAIMQILNQVEANGGTAVVYDPHLEFVSRYYNPDRGDFIANPLDERCFSWCPTDELDLSDRTAAEATALAQAESLYPGKPSDRDWFFINTSRLIYKHLLIEYQPESAKELGIWMQHPDPQIDMRVLGTELEQMLKANAAPQRAGIISTLTQVAFALRQIPDKTLGRPNWSVRDWCDKREGWIFFTNTQDTRTALRPLQSLWIDMLIMRILSQGPRPDMKPVYLILDELPTLQMLPQLQSAVTESRKTGLSIVIGFQGRSQIKALYGESAETIFSAPFTKILLRTSEPEAADWMSKMVGEIELERPRETRPVQAFGKHRTHSFTSEITTQRLVLPSEFTGLPDRTGYFRYGNYVVKIKIATVPPREKKVAFVARKGAPVKKAGVPTIDEYRAAKAAEAAQLTGQVATKPAPNLLPKPPVTKETESSK